MAHKYLPLALAATIACSQLAPYSSRAEEPYNPSVIIQLAQGGSGGLELKAGVDVSEISRQVKKESKNKGFCIALGDCLATAGAILISPFRPSQWKEHPYRTGAVTAGYIGGIAALASGDGGGRKEAPAVVSPEKYGHKRAVAGQNPAQPAQPPATPDIYAPDSNPVSGGRRDGGLGGR